MIKSIPRHVPNVNLLSKRKLKFLKYFLICTILARIKFSIQSHTPSRNNTRTQISILNIFAQINLKYLNNFKLKNPQCTGSEDHAKILKIPAQGAFPK